MKNLAHLAFTLGLVAFAGGCAVASTGGNEFITGGLYKDYKVSGAVRDGTGSKTGKACASSILGIVGTGDASLAAAKSAGGITKVAHVDHSSEGILGIWAEGCTIAVGE